MKGVIITDIYIRHRNDLTPAERYVSVTDMESLLREIEEELLPTGSGIPFPVQFKPGETPQNQPPWQNNVVYNNGFVGGDLL